MDVTRGITVIVGVLAVMAMMAGAAGSAAAAGPTDTLRLAITEALEILDDSQRKGPAMSGARRVALRRVIDRTIDFPDAARRALGPYWRERTAAEREEFVALFRELVMHSYVTHLETYAGEHVIYLAETIDEGVATVRTRIESNKRPDLPVDYRMHQVGQRWLVYDVLVEGSSLVANYRSQFHTIIQTSSYAELVRRIKRRLIELTASPPVAARYPPGREGAARSIWSG